MKITASRNSVIDIAKLVGAILVVAIHTRPFKEISEDADFFFGEIVCRWAVPFFAVCTGYYLSSAYKKKGTLTSVKRSIKKIGVLYLFWSLVFFCVHLYSWRGEDSATKITYISGWMKSVFISSSYYHLWYLVAMFYALIFFYGLLKYVKPVLYLPLAVLLWCVQIYMYTYNTFTPDFCVGFIDILYKFESLAKGFTRMLPLLIVGYLISEQERQNTKMSYFFAGLLGTMVLLIGEAYTLRAQGNTTVSYIFFTLPFSYFLFSCLQRVRCIGMNADWAGRISLIIYCIHPVFTYLLRNIGVEPSPLHFVLATTLSVVSGILWIKLQNN